MPCSCSYIFPTVSADEMHFLILTVGGKEEISWQGQSVSLGRVEERFESVSVDWIVNSFLFHLISVDPKTSLISGQLCKFCCILYLWHPEPNVTEILVKISSFSSLLIEDTMILIKTDVHNWFWSQLKCFWKAYLNDKQDEAKINNEFHECSSCHHFRGRYKILAYYFVWNI